MMTVLLAKNWWSLVMRGGAAILLGLSTIARHGLTLGALVMFFGAYAIFDGLIGLAGALRAAGANERWGSLLFEGLAGVAAGITTFAWPAMTPSSLIFIITAWALVTGILELVAAMRLRQHVPGDWLLALSGAASLVLGILMIAVPLVGQLAFALWLGIYGFVFGSLLIALGLRLRAWARERPAPGKLAAT